MNNNHTLFGNRDPRDPRIDVYQATLTDVSCIEQLELISRDFPWSVRQINELLKDGDVFCVKVFLNSKHHGWLAYRLDGNKIDVLRLSIKNEDLLKHVVDAIFKAITDVPGAVHQDYVCRVTWPLHETDRFLFRYLLHSDGWKQVGTVDDYDYAYGQWYDGIKLMKGY